MAVTLDSPPTALSATQSVEAALSGLRLREGGRRALYTRSGGGEERTVWQFAFLKQAVAGCFSDLGLPGDGRDALTRVAQRGAAARGMLGDREPDRSHTGLSQVLGTVRDLDVSVTLADTGKDVDGVSAAPPITSAAAEGTRRRHLSGGS